MSDDGRQSHTYHAYDDEDDDDGDATMLRSDFRDDRKRWRMHRRTAMRRRTRTSMRKMKTKT